jgi:hypothetical protein
MTDVMTFRMHAGLQPAARWLYKPRDRDSHSCLQSGCICQYSCNEALILGPTWSASLCILAVKRYEKCYLVICESLIYYHITTQHNTTQHIASHLIARHTSHITSHCITSHHKLHRTSHITSHRLLNTISVFISFINVFSLSLSSSCSLLIYILILLLSYCVLYVLSLFIAKIQ